MKDILQQELSKIGSKLTEISNYLYHNPELGDQEFKSSQLLMDFLKEHDFTVESNIAGRATAFKAEFNSDKPGPTIAYLAEYDALPGIGHGCGHNLIGTMSVGAGVTLSKLVNKLGGNIMILGTPAEETNGAKVSMTEQGIFDQVDAAMILHPDGQSSASGESLAMDAIAFSYTGKAAHAAASPEKGINALDSVIQLFNGINALREHFPSDVKVHGIISEGGQAANIVPERATAQFYIRAKERIILDEIVNRIKDVAQGAALMTGSTLEISNYELSYDNMITNEALSQAFTKNLMQNDSQTVHGPKQQYGSIDMGNVSHAVPSIHPYIGLNHPGLIGHTKAFADQTVTDDGHRALINGALSLAQTGYDVLNDETLLHAIKEEFSTQKETLK